MADSDSGTATVIAEVDEHDEEEDTSPPPPRIGRVNTDRLCSTCKKLDFSIEKFIITATELSRDGPADGALASYESGSVAASLHSQNGKHGSFRLNSGNSRYILATYSQVQDRRRACRFCDLAFRAVERYSRGRMDSSAILSLSWEVDGRQIFDRSSYNDGSDTGGSNQNQQSIVNRTRRIRLAWREKSGKEEAVYIVFVAPMGARRLNSDANADAARNTHFLGRASTTFKEKQALMTSWVDLCVKKHGLSCQNQHGDRAEFTKLVRGTYFGVIDVIDMQLKELPIVNGIPSRYIALSYVWGKKKPGSNDPYMTTRSNVMLHIQHGGLEKAWNRLPRTLQDAIQLVSRLGERYIWIDSLCIVQDSNSSWELNAKSMHLVYGNAHFTICAADGDAETGLLALDPLLRSNASASVLHPNNRHSMNGSISSTPPLSSSNMSHRQRQQNRASSSSFPNSGPGSGSLKPPPPNMVNGTTTDDLRGHQRAAEEAHSPPLTEEILPGIRLLVSRPAEAVIQDSHWNQRSWTFQERLLSRRCLIFAEGQVYFQCRSTVISQNIFTNGNSNGWSLDWTNSPLRTLGELKRRAFWFYMKCVSLYTGRYLTKPRDVLTAFGGVSWLLEEHMNAPLFYGLPMSHFDLALLWSPRDRLERRGRKSHKRGERGDSSLGSKCHVDELGNCACDNQDEGYGAKEFPSWSWAGWQGGKADYRLDMIDGSLTNVQEWLKSHTWILWYVRDFEGNLRPLWDKDVLSEDQSEECRWRGYRGKSPTRVRVQSPGSERSETERRRKSGRRKPGQYVRRSNQHYLGRLPDGYYDAGDLDREVDEWGEEVHADDEVDRTTRSSRAARGTIASNGDEVREETSVKVTEESTASRAPDAYRGSAVSSSHAHPDRMLYGPHDYAYDDPYADAYERGRPQRYTDPYYHPYGNPYAPPGGHVVVETTHYPSYPPPPPPPPAAVPLRGRPPYLGQSYGYPHRPRSRQSWRHDSRSSDYPPYEWRKSTSRVRRESRDPRASYIDVVEDVDDRHYDYEERDFPPPDDGASGVESHPVPYNSGEDFHHMSRSYSTVNNHAVHPPQGEDLFGRPIRDEVKGRNATEFTGILPDNPFGIIRGPFPEDRKDHARAMPILQFWTWRTEFFVTIRRDKAASYLMGNTSPTDPSGAQLPANGPEPHAPLSSLVQCDISDKGGDWCGAIMLPSTWITAPKREGKTQHLFIALSDAKVFTNEECPVWNYYIPKEKDESEWDLYYVMLLQRNKERALWERVAVGKVFQAAFRGAVWDEIKLG